MGLPIELNMDAWLEWLAYRKEMKFKKYKTNRVAANLATIPIDAQMECVLRSMNNEYQGLFPESIKAKHINFASTDF